MIVYLFIYLFIYLFYIYLKSGHYCCYLSDFPKNLELLREKEHDRS